MDPNKIDPTSVNKEKKQFKLPKLKNPFKKNTAGPGRDAEGKFTSGSGGLINTKNFNWKRAVPLMLVVALVGGFLVYRSFAGTYRACSTQDNGYVYSQDCVTNSDEAAVVRLYYGVFNRAPDKSGLQYWTNKLVAKKITLTEMARQFMGSSEFSRKYGNLSNQQFVEAMYPQVFGRDPDPSGLKYWVNKLNNKSITRQAMMANFTQSSEMKRSFSTQVAAALGISPTKYTSPIPVRYTASDIECYGTKVVKDGKTWCEQQYNAAEKTTRLGFTLQFKSSKPLLGNGTYIVCTNIRSTAIRSGGADFNYGTAYSTGSASNNTLQFQTSDYSAVYSWSMSTSVNTDGSGQVYRCFWQDTPLDTTSSSGFTVYGRSLSDRSVTYGYDMDSVYIGRVDSRTSVASEQNAPHSISSSQRTLNGGKQSVVPVNVPYATISASGTDKWVHDNNRYGVGQFGVSLNTQQRSSSDTTKLRVRIYNKDTGKDVPHSVQISKYGNTTDAPLEKGLVVLEGPVSSMSIKLTKFETSNLRLEITNVEGQPLYVNSSEMYSNY